MVVEGKTSVTLSEYDVTELSGRGDGGRRVQREVSDGEEIWRKWWQIVWPYFIFLSA